MCQRHQAGRHNTLSRDMIYTQNKDMGNKQGKRPPARFQSALAQGHTPLRASVHQAGTSEVQKYSADQHYEKCKASAHSTDLTPLHILPARQLPDCPLCSATPEVRCLGAAGSWVLLMQRLPGTGAPWVLHAESQATCGLADFISVDWIVFSGICVRECEACTCSTPPIDI